MFLRIFLTGWIVLMAYPVLAVDDAILAVVNDDLITLKDMHEYLSSIYFQLRASGKSPEDIKKIMADVEKNSLQQLIDDKLVITEANRKKIIVREKMVNDRLKEMKSRFASEEEFTSALLSEGMTISDLKKQVTDQIKTKYLIEMEVREKIFVNPQEVTDYYNKNINEFLNPERVNLLSIFVPYGQDRKASEQIIVSAEVELSKGISFEDVAKKYSQLPHLGIMAKDKLLPAIADMIATLKVGEVSKPIETDTGIYLLKIKEFLPSDQVTLEQVKDKIYQILFTEKLQKRAQEWIEKLRKNAYIEIKG